MLNSQKNIPLEVLTDRNSMHYHTKFIFLAAAYAWFNKKKTDISFVRTSYSAWGALHRPVITLPDFFLPQNFQSEQTKKLQTSLKKIPGDWLKKTGTQTYIYRYQEETRSFWTQLNARGQDLRKKTEGSFETFLYALIPTEEYFKLLWFTWNEYSPVIIDLVSKHPDIEKSEPATAPPTLLIAALNNYPSFFVRPATSIGKRHPSVIKEPSKKRRPLPEPYDINQLITEDNLDSLLAAGEQAAPSTDTLPNQALPTQVAANRVEKDITADMLTSDYNFFGISQLDVKAFDNFFDELNPPASPVSYWD